jgi:hypothetical protein
VPGVPNAMLALLTEIASPYGPDIPLPQKLAAGHVPDEALNAIPDLWSDRRPQITRDPKRSYHPYVPEPFTSRAFALPARTPLLDFAYWEETVRDVATLRHHLLYADGVALSDPIPKIFDRRYYSRRPIGEAFQYRRIRLANLAQFLNEVDLLVADEIIVFTHEPSYPVTYKADDLRQLAALPEIVKVVGRLDPDGMAISARGGEQILGLPEGKMAFGPESYAMHAFDGILAGLAAGSEAGGGWDLYLPQREMQPALDYLVNQAAGGSGTQMSLDPRDLRTLPRLLAVELPGICGNIRMSDLVALRRSEEAFAEWRDELRKALTTLSDDLEADPEMPQAAHLAALQKELRRSAARAKSQIGRSAALSHLKSGAVDATIGTIVGVPLGSPTAAVVSAGLSELAVLLYRWLSALPSRPARQALARHYAVFASSTG